jgi:hypothetical protein
MIKNQKAWDEWVTKNTDPYGKACVDVAREVMRILDEGKDFDCHKIIDDADDKIQAGGLTGFMAGCVAQMVKVCHSRGDEFNDKWNEYYGVSKEKAKGGTVNPAILTIGD